MKRLTRAKAVKIFCQTCMGCDEWYGGRSGTKTKESSILVKKCESKKCPLYFFRNGKDESRVTKTIQSYDASGVVSPA